MKNLIVVGFPGRHRASEVLSELQQLDRNWALDLTNAVAAYRTDEGHLRVDRSVSHSRISDDLVQLMSWQIQPGDSAVFAVIRAEDPEEIAEHFRGYGGTIFGTDLPPDQAEKVQNIIRTTG
jgi:uncharacterized membrane protein